MQLLPTLNVDDEFSNANITDDHCIPQSIKRLKIEKLTTAVKDSNSESSNAHVIADQWIPVNKTSMNPESENNSQRTSLITENKADTSLPSNILNTPRKIYRYPGDIKDELVEQMSPTTKSNCIRLLKSACKAKDKTIQKLKVNEFRHKKKISSLEKLYVNCKKNLISPRMLLKLYR
ncbi:PREDICTED: uncharacterized protein LOC105563092 [Vollenhovia emeryi]|uniref:uncharacterized protein LOC105563092 n=1 Tax=Vollenhovia emeryi TaxID=411798 RepID=UPI0005F54596|nr:PREDICTED: uncharacterized protein LOC105563092 [Vollenhovia emeryi]